jgi:hypothetical protein
MKHKCAYCYSSQHDLCDDGFSVNLIVTPFADSIDSCRIEHADDHLLVITRFADEPLEGFAARLNRAYGGLISEALVERGFEGKAGETLLLDSTDLGAFTHGWRYVWLVGLGYRDAYTEKALCALFGSGLDKAIELECSEVIFPVTREELIYGDVSAELFASVLRCRVSAMLCRQKAVDVIKSVEILCPSALEEEVAKGLQIKGPLCESCNMPRLVKLNVDGHVG